MWLKPGGQRWGGIYCCAQSRHCLWMVFDWQICGGHRRFFFTARWMSGDNNDCLLRICWGWFAQSPRVKKQGNKSSLFTQCVFFGGEATEKLFEVIVLHWWTCKYVHHETCFHLHPVPVLIGRFRTKLVEGHSQWGHVGRGQTATWLQLEFRLSLAPHDGL